MRRHRFLSFVLVVVSACAVEGGGEVDGVDDVAVTPGGKADGESFSPCELDAVVAYLNAGAGLQALLDGGVHTQAAEALVAHRDGLDGVPGTEDDDLFDDITEVDDVDYVGPVAMEQLVALAAGDCEVEDDPWAQARDVELAHVVLPADLAAPLSYVRPQVDGFYLSGTEFWQKWSGGHSPTYSFSDGTDAGRRCMQASAYRFEAIMADPPAELVQLRDESNWSGSFFNWNDDYVESTWGDASGARLWAWRTGLIKWISQTARDGSCHLPTRELVQRAAQACLDTAVRNGDGEIQGCSAR